LQQQRVFAEVFLPSNIPGAGDSARSSIQVVVFPTDWREQRRIVIAPVKPISSHVNLCSLHAGLNTSYVITDYSGSVEGAVLGFHVPFSFDESASVLAAAAVDSGEFISCTLHDVRGGLMIASFSTPTQPPIL
jgi:hypothetical protein